MQITDVKIRKLMSSGRLRAVVSITIDDMIAVHDIKVVQGDERLFVAMPSRKDENGIFRDIVHPINSDFRKRIEDAVLETYDAQKHDYFEDCKSELKIYLLGKDLSWKKLAGIEHKECISSWLETTSRRLFISIKPKLIDIVTDSTSIDEEDPEKPKIQIPVNFETLYDDQESMAVVIEAMATLTDNERFCFYMDVFKAYAHKDIAEMLRLKGEREGIKVKSNKKGVEYVTPDAGYVNVRIQRAKEKITKYYNKTYNIKITSWK